jgi:hypothetical protein
MGGYLSKNKKQLEEDVLALEKELEVIRRNLEAELSASAVRLAEKESSRLYAISKWTEYSKKVVELQQELKAIKENRTKDLCSLASSTLSKFILNIKLVCISIIQKLNR